MIPFGTPRAQNQPGERCRPEGWPVGSFEDYTSAQAAVDMLSDRGDFPVNELTIVGVNLMEVERVVGRLTWGRVLAAGAASGAWMGLFVGILMSLFSDSFLAPMIYGIVMGVVFGLIAAAVPYAASKGRRDFATTTQIVAGRYDVLCAPEHARRARDEIARAKLGGQYRSGS
ncbi:magnesium transporter [Corynebacterium sp. CCM 9185]|uniref:Magnesium transporter n=1 Tax=Corynebacterium marambiense TaxID=2765364 RepID=A0ABS0VTP9_9CORY|nr:general stress protein [Corynebacterium marambiense]MBI9000145.1 magnesium transporter [Corynebacterium marambiense]MCK7663499.1 magnesium transporter [Corynebacterium marambiense]MCX7542067.1 magnesium transporter [Corynebacterium marambiense]